MVNRRPAQTRARIAQTASRLRSLIHPEAVAPDELLVSERTGRIPYADAQALGYRPAEIGETFGPQWATYWFRLAATVPEHWAGRPVELVWDSGCEALLYRDGAPRAGARQGRRLRPHHRAARHAGRPRGARARDGLQRPDGPARPVPAAPRPHRPDLGARRRRPLAARAAARPPASSAPGSRCSTPRRGSWRGTSRRCASSSRSRGSSPPGRAGCSPSSTASPARSSPPTARTWPEARAILADLLAHRNAGSAHDVTAIGHAHIDTAWLWPLAETRRKVVRSWASQLALMDRYPEHRFAASSAQHYAWFEQDAPGLYERLRERVREGRWEVVGGSWVEPDLNLPSGESLVRQLLYGQRDLQERFGARCREFWTPDTFGYNGQVPQILRGAGIDRFLTQKLSWNQFTEPPHHSFAWAGIDGSRGARAHAAGRHLQRRGLDRRAARERRALQGPRPHGGEPARVRPRRRRRRADRGDARDGAPRRRPAGRPARAARADLRVLRPPRGGPRLAAADRGRAVLRVPPRHLHQPGAHQARQPRRRAAARRGGGRGGARAPARPRGAIRPRSCARSGRPCC